MQLSGGEFSSFFSFLMEPMTDLEPGSSSYPESPDIEKQNAQQEVEPGKAKAREVQKDGPGLVKKTKVRAKNPRTTFSFLQKLALENEFRRTPYPTVALRAQLAEKLGLRQEVVQNWFKKRRYRWRRDCPNVGTSVPVLNLEFIPSTQSGVQDFQCTCPPHSDTLSEADATVPVPRSFHYFI